MNFAVLAVPNVPRLSVYAGSPNTLRCTNAVLSPYRDVPLLYRCRTNGSADNAGRYSLVRLVHHFLIRLRDIVAIQRFDSDIAARFLSGAAVLNFVAVLDIVFAVIIFQPQVKAFTSERGHAVQVAPVTVSGI